MTRLLVISQSISGETNDVQGVSLVALITIVDVGLAKECVGRVV